MDKPINEYPNHPGGDPVFSREASNEDLNKDSDDKTGGIQSWYTKKELTKTGNYGRQF